MSLRVVYSTYEVTHSKALVNRQSKLLFQTFNYCSSIYNVDGLLLTGHCDPAARVERARFRPPGEHRRRARRVAARRALGGAAQPRRLGAALPAPGVPLVGRRSREPQHTALHQKQLLLVLVIDQLRRRFVARKRTASAVAGERVRRAGHVGGGHRGALSGRVCVPALLAALGAPRGRAHGGVRGESGRRLVHRTQRGLAPRGRVSEANTPTPHSTANRRVFNTRIEFRCSIMRITLASHSVVDHLC